MQTQLLLPNPTKILSLSSLTLTSPTHHLPWAPHRRRRLLLLPPIRMGGGPRTFPGGVSKWQWKRMQAKKSKQLLKARLLRERQIYEMRKRAELKAAVAQLEKPWELVEKAPTLFSVDADEQVKALADRFQKPGGFDMWSDRDGPQVLDNGSMLPSQRFFPKGVVHSVRPYGVVTDDEDEVGFESFDDWIARGGGGVRRRKRRKDRGEGVRSNADEKMDGDSDCIDVEASFMGDDNVQGSEMGRVGSEKLDVLEKVGGRRNSYSSDLDGNGKNLGRSRWRGGNRGVNAEKIALRPITDLSYDEGREMGHLGSEKLDVLEKVGGRRNSYSSDSNVNGKNLGRSRWRGGNHGVNAEKITLRPTTDLSYYEGREMGRLGSENLKVLEKVGGRRNSYSSGSDGNGRNLGRSRWRGGNHGVNAEKITLQLTKNLRYDEGREMGQLGSENSKVLERVDGRRNSYNSDSVGNGRNMGRSRWRGGNRQVNADKITPQSTTDLSYDESRDRVWDSKGWDGNGIRRNRGRSL